MVTDVVRAYDPLCLDEVGVEQGGSRVGGDQWPIGVVLAADLVAAAIALPLALLLLAVSSPTATNSLRYFWRNVGADASFPVAIVLALALAGFYRSNRRAPYESSFSELKELAVALCAGCVLAIAFSLFVHLGFGVAESDSTQLLLAAIIAIALITAARATIGAFRRGIYAKVLIVGSDSIVERISTYLGLIKGVEVVGRVVDALSADDGSLGTVGDLPQLCEKFGANRIIVAYPTSMSHESVAIMRSLPASVDVSIVPRYFELVSWRSRISDLYGLPLIEVAPAHLSRWDRFFKRSFDLVASSLLLVVLSPVLVLLSVLVKLSSPGPVLFRQVRVGQGRRPFTIYKFRTMRDGAEEPSDDEDGPRDPSAPLHQLRNKAVEACRITKIGRFMRKTGLDEIPQFLNVLLGDMSLVGPRDPSAPLHQLRNKADEACRITKIGRFMRKTGLDEIPQFLNVLWGDMSLVGPRPFTESETETITGWQARRFELRPGITGLWQVSGRNDLGMDDLRRLDYLYVASWSLWWDVKIVWDTPRAMVRGFGAY